jgi:ubiquinone/menaquinone biosynthesis C-methylase UbiE
MTDKIKKAYHDSKNIYDDVLTQGNFFSRLYIKLFWSGTDDKEIARKVLSYIPDDFYGTLLDVPVGTAVFTHRKWKNLINSKIVCIDYSSDMIEQAEKRLDNQQHISCIQGDVGRLPMENESVNIVVSMNGFHAFPDKNKAFQEIWRVLKPGGKFIACFYIKGESAITDWLVKTVLSKKGWFTPPFYTQKELKDILQKQYKDIDFDIDGSMVYFACNK